MKHTYNIYETYTGKAADCFDYKNKENAIKLARHYALKRKQSMSVIIKEDDTCIAICEFPYYLRNCDLEISDIYVNKI